MFKYHNAEENLKDKLSSYINKGESLIVSDIIEYNEKEYREVLFNKKSFVMEEIKGIVYIDENNKVITTNNIKEALTRLAYYYEILFNVDNKNNILKALRNEEDLQKENKDIEISIRALEFLEKEGMKNTDKVKSVLLRLPSLRKESNDLLKEMKLTIEDIFNREGKISEEAFERVYPIYKEILKLNFKNIKLIYSGIDYYDFIKESEQKKRKSFSIRFNRKLSEPLFKLDYQINYFKKLLKTYDKIISMNERDYLKFTDDAEKNNINERLKILRNETSD